MLLAPESDDFSPPGRLFDEFAQDDIRRRSEVDASPVNDFGIRQIEPARLIAIEKIVRHSQYTEKDGSTYNIGTGLPS